MYFFDYWTYDKLLLNIRETLRYWGLNENRGRGEEGGWKVKVKLRVGEAVWPRVLMIWGGKLWTGFSDLWALWGMSHVHKGRFIASKVVALLVKQTSLWYAITSRCAICYLKRKKNFLLEMEFPWMKINLSRDLKMWKWTVKFLLGMLKFVESSLCIETVRQC